MRRVPRSLALLLALGACAVEDASREAPPTAPRPEAGWVDIELALGELPALGCSAGVTALDAAGRTRGRLPSLDPGAGAEVGPLRVVLAGVDLGPPPVTLHPSGGARLQAGAASYRGDLRLEWHAARGAPRLLNRVALEDYLLGVVPAEMPDRFGLEALKAQAVAARTYALAESSAQGFLYGDTRSQAYGGRARETPLTSRAVRETAGQVLLRRGRVITAWYHSTCGGRTLPAREVFDDASPGVLDRAVDCPDCRDAPLFAWERRFSAADVCAALGLDVAPLEAVSAPADAWPARPASLAVIAGGRTASAPFTEVRARLSQGRPLARQLPSARLSAPPELQAGELVLRGSGFGHGVGLCQYGAAGFAARGGGWQAILERYYPGATLGPAP
jgi:stage II sporulation protein D